MDHSIHPIDDWALATEAYLSRYTGNTRAAYTRDLAHFTAWAREHLLEPLTMRRQHLEMYRAHMENDLELAPATVYRRLSTLRGVYNLAAADDLIAKPPTLMLRLPKVHVDDTSILGLGRQGMIAMIHASKTTGNPMDEALIALLAYLALRVGEACSLNIEDLGGIEREHRVARFIGKGGKPATVPLPPTVIRALAGAIGDRTHGPLLLRRDGQRLDRNRAYHWVQRIGRLAGIPDVHPHALRHGAITAALDSGVEIRDAQTFARHADIRMTNRYDRGRHNLDRHASYGLASFLGAA